MRGTCAKCGAADKLLSPSGACFDANAKGERIAGTGCYGAAETAERGRLDGLATAMGCTRDEVNPHTLAAAAGVLPSEWHTVTVEKILPKQAAVRAAVAAAKGKP